MSVEGKDDYLDCSFVSIHYIICECGETFPSENGLRAHLEKEHPHKRERKEFKCGVCGSIFNTEDECINHYENNHIIDIKHEPDDETELQDDEVDSKEGVLMQDEMEEMDMEEDQQAELMDEDIGEEHIIGDHLIMNEETGELTIEVPQMKSNLEETTSKLQAIPELQIKLTKPRQTVKSNKLMVESVKPDRIVVKQQSLMVTAGDDGTESQVLHIPEEYGQLLQVTPDGQLVIVMNNEVVNLQKEPKQPKKPTKEPQDPTKPRPKKIAKHIVCEVCGKKYASNAALKYHQRVHTGEKPYQCPLCSKSFAMPLFLQIHIRTHTGERPYQCPECPKAFSNKAALLRHDRVHTGEKPYECPMCLKSFTQSNSLKLHVATVHLKQPAPYKSKNRKIKAQERAMKNKADEMLKQKVAELMHENEDGEAARNIAVQTEEGNIYEVIESEEVINEDKAVYTLVYEDN